MRDESFHTDREVGEFIEGLRASSRRRRRGSQARYDSTQPQGDQPSGQNAELLAMIRDMETQLQALSGAGVETDPAPYSNYQRTRTNRPRPEAGHDHNREANYRGALDRIEAQLQRVDQALGRNKSKAMPAMPRSMRPRQERPMSPAQDASVAPRPVTNPVANTGVDQALRQIMERVETMAPKVEGNATQLQHQDDKINCLREDVAALRDLLDRANYDGVSERLLTEIAAMSGRIEALSEMVTQTHHDPMLIDAIHDIRALLDRPAQDPALDAHFERILSKLDNLPVADHFKDFERLSGQLDQLRDLLSTSPRMQHITDMSGQMGMIVDRLGRLEDSVRHSVSTAPVDALSQQLGNRLAGLQDQIERLDPSERLMRLEDQFSALADRLESNQDQSGVTEPIEVLARQMESLVTMIDRQDPTAQRSALEQLATRIGDLDERLHANMANIGLGAAEQRFDHVERTLARIDDLLAQRMGSTDLSGIETGLSRLADRMEAQEAALRARPVQSEPTDMEGLSRLEGMIADLADRLDDASQNKTGGDQQFFESLTSRLDSLADQFAKSQTRFDAVDRIGKDIQQLASAAPKAPMNEAKMAEAAAVKALQKIGPLSAGPMDNALEAIMDGLKDDLSGLRRLAESNESSTKESLTSVSGMLKGIADRLSVLEEEVRSSETHPAASAHPAASVKGMSVESNADDEPRGLSRLLRRGKKSSKPADASSARDTEPQVIENAQQMSAADLLANRPQRTPRSGAAPTVSSPAPSQGRSSGQAVEAQSQDAGDRQPRISISGRAVSASAASASQPQARAPGQMQPQARPTVQGNVALKAEPEQSPETQRRTAQIVDGNAQGPARSETSGGTSKADFIAAARRAAQAAAQESERVEKEDSEKQGFLSRFKGSKKGKAETQASSAADMLAARGMKDGQDTARGKDGQNRKDRRAAMAEATRNAKQLKNLDPDAIAEKLNSNPNAALVADMLEDDEIRTSLLGKIGSAVSRHSRPLLMAAAAILLAITTLQLVQNPNSSLHGLFNKLTAEQEAAPTSLDQAPASDTEAEPQAPGPQSSLAPASGNVMPPMKGKDASRAITFSQPSGVEASLAGPRLPQKPTTAASEGIATFMPQQSGQVPGIVPGEADGVDLTPTSSIPSKVAADVSALQADAATQPMPPKPADAPTAAGDDEVDPALSSIQAAVDMNKILAPGISTSPLLTAAKGGDALAQFEMGRRLTLGEGVSADLQEAATWFEKAAAQSMPQAQYSLANLYEKGKGVKRDYQVARLWYQRAAEAGNVKAMHNLAVLYAEGGLGKPDFNQASKWFIAAADHGLKDSQYNLAILYARGMGMKQDLLQSYKWFAIAAQNGDQGANAKRDEVFAVLNPTQQKAAKTLVETWVPKVAKPSANKLASIPDAWRNKAPAVVTGMQSGPQGFVVNQATIAKTQSMLGALGYNAGPADGQMGPMTRTAIRNFQEVAGMPVTGKVDKALIEALSMRII
ncbi:peptidoglycan-binding protein [Cohaesibacter intestini]|uniref:peptidoglycan-binding protein n=1 Tax=Cohaesibacter intestini TaxID=2211145 RepID=UPI000DE983A0|nr:peptidoglycan-binding protein [Cohaesibacter intestini]